MENTFEAAKKYIDQLDEINTKWNLDKNTIASAFMSYSSKTIKPTKEALEGFIEQFRRWHMEWDLFDRQETLKKPKSLNEFIDELNEMEQASRDNKNKLDYTILPWEAFEEVIKAFKQGEKDYGRGNYQKGEGLSLQSYRESMFRHLVASANGIELDEKSGADHIGHLAANCLMYLWQKQHEAKKPEMVELRCWSCDFPFILPDEDFLQCPSCEAVIKGTAPITEEAKKETTLRLIEKWKSLEAKHGLPIFQQNTLTPFGESLKLLRELADMQNDAPLEAYRKKWEETMKEVYGFLETWEEPVDLSKMKAVSERCNTCLTLNQGLFNAHQETLACAGCGKLLHI